MSEGAAVCQIGSGSYSFVSKGFRKTDLPPPGMGLSGSRKPSEPRITPITRMKAEAEVSEC